MDKSFPNYYIIVLTVICSVVWNILACQFEAILILILLTACLHNAPRLISDRLIEICFDNLGKQKNLV